MQAANKGYYSSRGKEIYSDFLTFAQGKALATCNAIEFVDDFSTANEPVVCEYGIGEGDFAKTFLDEVKRRDAALYKRTQYHLFDLSEKMISDAKKNLSSHKSICSFRKFDAAFETPSLEFDYCRINELLTDLPADLYSKKSGRILHADGKMVSSPSPLVTAMLSRMDEKRHVPFNFAAEKFLSSLCACGKPGFRVDVFDYGFYSADDIFTLPVEEWNRVITRTYGTQITIDLNFLQISSSLISQNFAVQVEKQKDYAEGVLGKKLEFRQTEKGLDYAPAKDTEVSEDDGFYHLRIGR